MFIVQDDLFERLISFENIYSAYLKSRKGKRYLDYVLRFEKNLEQNLLSIQRDLKNETYVHGSYKEMIVCDSKKRLIKVAPFRDRIVHHAICNIIEPIIDKKFIHDSYACRKNKGTHKAINRLQSFLRKKDTTFCLQCDVSKYFQSIDHKTLFRLCQKKITNQKILLLLAKIINSSHDYVFINQEEVEQRKGIPIGNLTSQLFANLYLNELDQFIKHQIKTKYYLRYMDDFILLAKNKLSLNQAKLKIIDFLRNKLNLALHPKKVNLFPTNKGINFLGYVIHQTYKLLRKTTVLRFIRRTKTYKHELKRGQISKKEIQESITSWKSYANKANTYKLQQSLNKKLEIT